MADPFVRIPLWERFVWGLGIAYFVFRLCLLAATVTPDLPPDEETHVGIIRLYAASPLGVENTPDSYRLGLVTHVPNLYHAFMGMLLRLNVFSTNTYLFLRLINVLLGVLTILFIYRLAVLLIESPYTRLLVMVLSTNTLMYTFLWASVSYDNLVNLLATASLYSLFAFLVDRRTRHLSWFLCLVSAGCLTKVSFLPLALLMAAVLVFERRTALLSDLRRVGEAIFEGGTVDRLLPFVAIAIAVCVIWLYGGNAIRYGKPVPACNDVLSTDQCMENRIFARDAILTAYRQGSLSYETAVARAQRIRLEGDRQHALRLIDNERDYRAGRFPLLNRYEYTSTLWDRAVKPSIFGIMAHRSLLRSPDSLLPYNVIILAAFVLWIRRIRFDDSAKQMNYLAIIGWGYGLFLLGHYNYRSYLHSHAMFLGVQGRYLFPVLPCAYLLMADAFGSLRSRVFRGLAFLAIASIFVLGDYPYFRDNADAGWFSTPVTSRSQPSNTPTRP